LYIKRWTKNFRFVGSKAGIGAKVEDELIGAPSNGGTRNKGECGQGEMEK